MVWRTKWHVIFQSLKQDLLWKEEKNLNFVPIRETKKPQQGLMNHTTTLTEKVIQTCKSAWAHVCENKLGQLSKWDVIDECNIKTVRKVEGVVKTEADLGLLQHPSCNIWNSHRCASGEKKYQELADGKARSSAKSG